MKRLTEAQRAAVAAVDHVVADERRPDRLAQLHLDRCCEHRRAGDQRDTDQHRRGGARRALRVALHVAARHRAGDTAPPLNRCTEQPGDRPSHHRAEQQHRGEQQRNADRQQDAVGTEQHGDDRCHAQHAHTRRRRSTRPRTDPVRSNAVSAIAATGGTRPAPIAGAIAAIRLAAVPATIVSATVNGSSASPRAGSSSRARRAGCGCRAPDRFRRTGRQSNRAARSTADSISSVHVTWRRLAPMARSRAFSRWRCAAVIENTL